MYLKYLKGKVGPNDPVSFLTMHEFGPWDTQEQSHMRHLAEILLAITLRADAEAESAGPGKSGPPKKGRLFQ